MHSKTKKNVLKVILSYVMTLGFATSALALTTLGQGAPRTVLPKLYFLDNLEIEAGELGIQKACDARVKSYARMLKVEHTNHRLQVESQARSRNIYHARVRLTQAETAEVQKIQRSLIELRAMNNCDFDSDYLFAMIDAHTFVMSVTRAAMTRENDRSLRSFLNGTLASLRAHREQARVLLNTLEKDGSEEEDGDQDQDDGDQDDDDQDEGQQDGDQDDQQLAAA